MFELTDYLIAIALFFGAIIYTSVGHAGASSYIAIMALFGIDAATIKPTALTLNIAVASYSSYSYIKAKLYDLRLALPLIFGAIPTAYLGGMVNLPDEIYKPIVGVILLLSAYMFLFKKATNETQSAACLGASKKVAIGASIGFLAGLTGTGGGIFLSPLVILLGCTSAKSASGTASLFILFNSIFGLIGNAQSIGYLPNTIPLYLVFVLCGAFIGTRLGTKHFDNQKVRKALALVLIIAGLKMIFTA